PDYRAWTNERLITAAATVARRECLAVLARELGFDGWPQAKGVISGTGVASNFGTLLYPRQCAGHLNLWYSRYDEAVVGHRASSGYLLAYRRDFLVVGRSFIEALGLNPDAPEWTALGFDWVRPGDVRARTRLYGMLIAQMPREGDR